MAAGAWDNVGQPVTGAGAASESGAGTAADSGPGSAAAGAGATDTSRGQGSGEGSDELENVIERVLERLGSVVDNRLASMRQDLDTEMQRRVQSLSDKAAHRLSQQQRERLTLLDQHLSGLEEVLGPDFEQVRNKKRLEILLDTDDKGEQEQPEETEPTGQGAPDFAQVYLSEKLGRPEDWTAEEQAAIRRDLSQARDMVTWMAAVERYAVQRTGRQQQGQSPNEGDGRNVRAARAQPVGGQAGGAGQMTPEQLQAAYNRAAAARDMAEMQRLGQLIDKLTRG